MQFACLNKLHDIDGDCHLKADCAVVLCTADGDQVFVVICQFIQQGKIVGSFAYGTQELYSFMDNNPAVCEYDLLLFIHRF